jgi:hypothetical protein
MKWQLAVIPACLVLAQGCQQSKNDATSSGPLQPLPAVAVCKRPTKPPAIPDPKTASDDTMKAA